jgi:hypothetical protein
MPNSGVVRTCCSNYIVSCLTLDCQCGILPETRIAACAEVFSNGRCPAVILTDKMGVGIIPEIMSRRYMWVVCERISMGLTFRYHRVLVSSSITLHCQQAIMRGLRCLILDCSGKRCILIGVECSAGRITGRFNTVSSSCGRFITGRFNTGPLIQYVCIYWSSMYLSLDFQCNVYAKL